MIQLQAIPKKDPGASKAVGGKVIFSQGAHLVLENLLPVLQRTKTAVM